MVLTIIYLIMYNFIYISFIYIYLRIFQRHIFRFDTFVEVLLGVFVHVWN